MGAERNNGRNQRYYSSRNLTPTTYERVGLDALYALILLADAPEAGVHCEVRLNVTSTDSRSAA